MIEIDGEQIEYDNVASITPQITTEYYHNVTSLSGIKYQDVRYKKTDYQIVFYDPLDGDKYENLKQFIRDARNTPVKCYLPHRLGYVYANFYLTIIDENFKGFISNGRYYKTGLTVLFEKEIADVR